MDSTLGKILSGILVLLALAIVVALGGVTLSRHSTNGLVGGISAMAANIQGDYTNNTAGYGTLSNATVIAAGEVPSDLLQNGQIVSPWGKAITVSPVSGSTQNFQIDLGAVPAQNCVDLLVHTGGLAGAVVAGTQVVVPVDPATAATACATGGDLTLQFGAKAVPVGFQVPTTGWQSIPGTWSANETAWSVVNYGQQVGYQSLTQETVTNSTGAPFATTLNFNNVNNQVGTNNQQWVTRKVYVNGAYIGTCSSTSGNDVSANCSLPMTLAAGTNTITFVDAAETTTQYQTSLYATASLPAGVTPISSAYSNIGSWSYQLIKN